MDGVWWLKDERERTGNSLVGGLWGNDEDSEYPHPHPLTAHPPPPSILCAWVGQRQQIPGGGMNEWSASENPSHDTFPRLLSTDTHLGYWFPQLAGPLTRWELRKIRKSARIKGPLHETRTLGGKAQLFTCCCFLMQPLEISLFSSINQPYSVHTFYIPL